MNKVDTPIALFMYNREATLVEVLNVLVHFSPPILFLIGDGPKEHVSNDRKKVARAREIALSRLKNHNLDVKFAPKNLGLLDSFVGGFEYVFSKVDRCIFLEDDTVPSPEFFHFCDELLEVYKSNPRVTSISGTNLLGKESETLLGIESETSFYFSRYPQIWGWATWRHKWISNYDSSIQDWRLRRGSKKYCRKLGNSDSIRYWSKKFDSIVNGSLNTWDAQVAHMFFYNDFLSVIPSSNLVTNIGFNNPDATNTRGRSGIANLTRHGIKFPLAYPELVEPNAEFDAILSRRYSTPSLFKRAISKLLRITKAQKMSKRIVYF